MAGIPFPMSKHLWPCSAMSITHCDELPRSERVRAGRCCAARARYMPPDPIEAKYAIVTRRFLSSRRDDQMSLCTVYSPRCATVGDCPTIDCPGGVVLTAALIARAWVDRRHRWLEFDRGRVGGLAHGF